MRTVQHENRFAVKNEQNIRNGIVSDQTKSRPE